MCSNDNNQPCKVCGQPISIDEQVYPTHVTYIGTCRTNGCDLKGITRALDDLANMTQEEIDGYAAIVRRNADWMAQQITREDEINARYARYGLLGG